MIHAASILFFTAALGAPAANDIQWQSSFEKTLEKAAAEKKVVFLAVNMDGEKANERMLEKVYTEKSVVELSKQTLNIVASTAIAWILDSTALTGSSRFGGGPWTGGGADISPPRIGPCVTSRSWPPSCSARKVR